MEFPLSKREWKLYNELKESFSVQRDLEVYTSAFNKYDEWLSFLAENDVLFEIRFDGGAIFRCESSFDDFEEWLNDQDRKAKRLKSREWKIAIVSAVIGALIGLIPSIVTWIR